MNGRSIRFRLTAWYSAILAITFAVGAVAVWVGLRQSIQETVDKDLRGRVQAMRTYVDREGPEHGTSQLADELEEQAATAPVGTHLRVADRTGHWIYRSPGTKDWNSQAPKFESLPVRGSAQTLMVNRESIRVLSAPSRVGIIQIGTSIDEFEDMLGDFRWTFLLASPVLLLLASLGGYWMSGRALKPVDQIARTARRISAQNLSERLSVRKTGDELDRLSATLNDMLAGLEAAFDKIAQFTADASHELRTPVAIIRTTAEVIRGKPRTVQEHEAGWDQIVAQAERTSQLIDNLLLLSRADAGRDDLTFEAMDLGEGLREACEEMRIMAEAAGLRLSSSLPPEYPIRGDREALRRLFLILIDNAIKYTKAGGEINVSLAPDCGSAVVEVRDTGVGISPEDLPHVFDRFYRAAKDRSRKTGGAGLGLSIAQWIAGRHGGKILVDSALGMGSTFRVFLPES